MGFARSAEQVAALLKQKKITLDSIYKEILEDTTLPYSNIPKEKRYIPSGKRSPFMFIGQNPVEASDEYVEIAKNRGKPLEFFEVSDDLKTNHNGLLLNQCIEYFGLKREDVYVTNAVKYPSPENKEPTALEAKNHIKKFLFKEIYVVKPEIIFCMGNAVTTWMNKVFGIEITEDPQKLVLNLKMDDERIEYECYIQKIYHPAYVKRNGNDFSMYIPQLDKSKKIVEDLILDWKFVHLHAHNSFSLKDGVGDPGTRIKWAVENRKNALATSNHGNIFDWLQIYNKCKPEKIKPILGAEFYFNRYGKELQESLKDDTSENKKIRKDLRKYTNHVTAFAKNIQGYYNMIKINNDAWVNRFYRNPITAPIDYEENHEGIICLSGCSGSEANRVITRKYSLLSENRIVEINRIIEEKLSLMRSAFRAESEEKLDDEDDWGDFESQYFNDHRDEKLNEADYEEKARAYYTEQDKIEIESADQKAREIIKWWHNIFKDDFYIELMVIDYAPQYVINQELIKIAKEMKIPIVITNDVHYLERGGSKIQQLQMLNDQEKTFADLAKDENNDIWTIKSQEFYFKTVSELKESWEKWHKSEIFTEEIFYEGIKNTIAISDKVENFTIDKSNKLPQMGADSKNILAKKIVEGLKNRGLSNKKEYKDRAMFEYEIICAKGFADYFLIISDIIQYSKRCFGKDSVGPGRGCFVPDSLVKMSDATFKKIKDINSGDEVISGWGSKRNVKNKFEYDVKEDMTKINLKNGDSISCTNDHKILVIPKGKEKDLKNAIWKPASELINGDILIKNI